MQSIYHDEIRNAIFEHIAEKKQLHKRDVKSAIDDIKNKYILESKIGLEELGKIITHFKSNWQGFKDQAKDMRRTGEFIQFRRFQI
jgi:hypothetical protein